MAGRRRQARLGRRRIRRADFRVSTATSRSSPPSTALRWAAASRLRWPATSSLPPRMRGSHCPSRTSALAALAGGLHACPRQIGLKRAMGNDPHRAARHRQEGHELGFVNEVVRQAKRSSPRTLGGDHLQEQPDVDPRLQTGDSKGLAVSLEQAMAEQREYPAVKAMAARRLYRGAESLFGKAPPKWVGRVVARHRVPDAVQRSLRCTAEPGPRLPRRMDPGSAAHHAARRRAAQHPGTCCCYFRPAPSCTTRSFG